MSSTIIVDTRATALVTGRKWGIRHELHGSPLVRGPMPPILGCTHIDTEMQIAVVGERMRGYHPQSTCRPLLGEGLA